MTDLVALALSCIVAGFAGGVSATVIASNIIKGKYRGRCSRSTDRFASGTREG